MPRYRAIPDSYKKARSLRKEMTLFETKLWGVLRDKQLNGIVFRRQHPIGQYIVDFCAPRLKLVIELDGNQHLNQGEYDAERTAYLELLGYHVIRFWDSDVMKNLNGVVAQILFEIEKRMKN